MRFCFINFVKILTIFRITVLVKNVRFCTTRRITKNGICISGTGTFGRVLLCQEKATNKFYAMKILTIADVIRLKQTEHVKNEKNILLEINHPLLVTL